MADPELFGLAAMLILGGFGSWYASLRRIRWVRDTPTARIRSAAQGVVELVGRVRPPPEEHLVSPMTAQPAVWWECTVSRRDSDSGGRRRWKTVAQRRSDVPFLLDDGSGVCMVRPDGAQVTAQVRIWYGSTPWPRSGPPTSRWGWLTDTPYRYTEKLLPSGQEIYVLGEFRTHRVQDGQDARAQLIQRLAEWKRDPDTLRARFDRNGDGKVDLAEWEMAREAARAETETAHEDAARQPESDWLAAPSDGTPFILSIKSEAHMLQQARWTALAGLMAGLMGLILMVHFLRLTASST
ncbi:MAG: GIDE domain-containing protein [Candidatus Macondimonas sp.]